MTKIPEHTKKFMKELDAQTETVRHLVKGMILDVPPDVFPPSSPFRRSSTVLYDVLTNLRDKRVLDIGTGSGVQALIAAQQGACLVHATDIYEPAVLCAQHNVQKNNFDHLVTVSHGHLFEPVRGERFDVIIANLPILDGYVKDLRWHALFDPGFEYLRELLATAQNYLLSEGRILFTSADLAGPQSFDELEEHGVTWRSYELRR